ncbi:hypothetical protein [Streptomyces sp. NPDC005244]|uniref:hypothetical protein n=1 Tax=Streptomyces sp. NPDC005244 TaxID=3364708 RepID=UPI00369B403F
MRFPRVSDSELLDVIDRYVKPTSDGTGRYLHLLHANFSRDDERERTPLQGAAGEVHEVQVGIVGGGPAHSASALDRCS